MMSKSKRCSGCQNLEDTLDEVVQASLKHQKAATDLKDTVKNQKTKIQEFREANSKLYDDIYSLEDDIRDKEAFVNKVVKERNDHQQELKFLNEKLEVKKEDISNLNLTLEKQKKISEVEIKRIMEENKALETKIKAVAEEKAKNDDIIAAEKIENDLEKIRLKEEIQELSNFRSMKEKNEETETENKEKEIKEELKALEEEVKNLQVKNTEKEVWIEELVREKKTLDLQLKSLSVQTCTLNVEKGETNEVPTSKSLEEELESCNGMDILSMFPCESCERIFSNNTDMKQHVKDVHIHAARLELFELERKVANQTRIFATSANKVMKKEISKKHEPCTCRKFCNISHSKHNWKKSFSSEIISRFEEFKRNQKGVKMGKYSDMV